MFGWLKSAFKKREVPTQKVVEPEVAVANAHPINRDLADASVYKPFADTVALLLEECHKQGVLLYAFEVYRSDERQQQLYAQGRTAQGPRVTNADSGLSFHNYGLAVDLVFDRDAVKPGYQWTWDGNYAALGKIIKEKFADKLEWAGNWTSFQEYPHVQWKTSVGVRELKAAKAVGGLQGAWQLLKRKPEVKKTPVKKPEVKKPDTMKVATVKSKLKKKAPAKKKV